jgi:hypothetical protein
VTASRAALETGSVRVNLRQSNAVPSAVPAAAFFVADRMVFPACHRQRGGDILTVDVDI